MRNSEFKPSTKVTGSSQKGRVILVKSNLLEQDPRLNKEIDTLKRAGYMVNLICWDRECGASPAPQKAGNDGIYEIRLRFKAPWGVKVLPFLPVWWCFIFYQILKTPWDIAHAINFDSVIPVVIAAGIKGQSVIYEIFDTYEDLVLLPRVLRNALVYLDKIFLHAARAVIIVDESRIEEFAGIPNDNVIIIYNSPSDLSIDLKVPDVKENGVFSLFYAGTLNRNRPLDKVVRAVVAIDGVRLTVAGYGESVKEIESWAAAIPEKIQFIGKISYPEVLACTIIADLLFSFYNPDIPLVKYASSNKLFEAMMCRKPILVGDGTSMAQIVTRENCGLVVDCNSIDKIRDAIVRLKEDPGLCRHLGENGRKAYEQRYSWEIMQKKLLDLYNGLAQEAKSDG
jgi:glycosyltransferase involved in cell wall biosynthesis